MQYLVVGVCDNKIEYLHQFDWHNGAIAKAVELGKKLYNEDSVNKFTKKNNLEEQDIYSIYHRYFRSEEYLDQNENASIEIIGIDI